MGAMGRIRYDAWRDWRKNLQLVQTSVQAVTIMSEYDDERFVDNDELISSIIEDAKTIKLKMEKIGFEIEHKYSNGLGREWVLRSTSNENEAAVIKPLRPPMPSFHAIRRALKLRQRRSAIFEASLFSDPAWDMLLDLAAAAAENKPITATSLCIASGAPTTTALRYIGHLEKAGLVQTFKDQGDRRRRYVALTEKARRKLAEYFSIAISEGTIGV